MTSLVVGIGCSSSSSTPKAVGAAGSGGAASCESGVSLADGTCVVAGVPASECGAGFTADGKQGCEPVLPAEDCPDGTFPLIGQVMCQPIGVPSGQCGAGFRADGQGGCQEVLPTADCPAGQMAIPGDMECHEVQSCGTGTWGDIVSDATTQFVNVAYSGGASDGTKEKPWTTLSDALSHASIGATVALAAGEYPENVILTKGAHLVGVCPSLVSIRGTVLGSAAVTVPPLPEGQTVEIRGVGITGNADGLDVRGASGVTLVASWVHDTGDTSSGIHVSYQGGPGSLSIQNCLLERTHRQGLTIDGSSATVDATVIRNTLPEASGNNRQGAGIVTEVKAGHRGQLALSHSLVDHSVYAGLEVLGSDVSIESSVVRNTQPDASDMTGGWGIIAQDVSGQAGAVTLTSSVIAMNLRAGMTLIGSEATVLYSVVRDTQPQASDMTEGRGIEVGSDNGLRGKLTLTSSLLERNYDVGVQISGADASVQGVRIRDTHSQASNHNDGVGLSVESDGMSRGALTASSILLDGNDGGGLVVGGADAAVQGAVVRDSGFMNTGSTPTLATAWGIFVGNPDGVAATLSLRGSIVEKSRGAGVVVFGSTLTMDSTLIRDTIALDNNAATGLGLAAIVRQGQRANVQIRGSLLERNVYQGILVMGSDASVQSTVIRNTAPLPDMTQGVGMTVQDYLGERAALTLSSSLLDGNHDVAVQTFDSDATLQTSILRNTLVQSSDQTLGDGVSSLLSHVTVTGCVLEANARAAISNFGSDITLEHVVASCSPILFDEEVQTPDPSSGLPATPVNATFKPEKTTCFACDGSPTKCTAVSKKLTPPSPVPPLAGALAQ